MIIIHVSKEGSKKGVSKMCVHKINCIYSKGIPEIYKIYHILCPIIN